MDERLVQLFERLKFIYESSGHPLCPECGIEFDHEPDCLFDNLMQKQEPRSHDSTLDELERLKNTLKELRKWVEYYPLKIFPEPDLKLAMEALNVVGITLDAVSASAMRHVLTQVTEMIDKTL